MHKNLSVRLVGEFPLTYKGKRVGQAFMSRGDLVDLQVDDPEVIDLIRANMGDFSLGFNPTEAEKKED